MFTGYKLQQADGHRILLELEISGRRVTLEGIAQYEEGELRIPIRDITGDFTLILNESNWNGEITQAPDGNAFLIRIKSTQLEAK